MNACTPGEGDGGDSMLVREAHITKITNCQFYPKKESFSYLDWCKSWISLLHLFFSLFYRQGKDTIQKAPTACTLYEYSETRAQKQLNEEKKKRPRN
uniref:Uncharacterized protein n=1 Tax=Rhizophora mucronata TaxID=61149 RepID=A0A2P2P894_RHIMU